MRLDESFSIHCNIQYLLTEIYKIKIGHSPPIMKNISHIEENAFSDLRSGVTVTRSNIKTRKFGFKTVSTIGSTLRNNLSNELKNAASLDILSKNIKFSSPSSCPCKIF